MYVRKNKKNKTAIYHGVSRCQRFFLLLQASGVFVDNLVEFLEYKDCCTRRNISVFTSGKSHRAMWRHLRFYEWFNGNVSLPAIFLSFQQYLENIPVCTLMLFSSFGKRRHFGMHLARSVFPLYSCLLSSLPRMFRGSGFSFVHRETEHVFCFSPPVCFRRYTRTAEEPRSSFSIRGTLWVKTILLNSFQRFPRQAKTRI